MTVAFAAAALALTSGPLRQQHITETSSVGSQVEKDACVQGTVAVAPACRSFGQDAYNGAREVHALFVQYGPGLLHFGDGAFKDMKADCGGGGDAVFTVTRECCLLYTSPSPRD